MSRSRDGVDCTSARHGTTLIALVAVSRVTNQRQELQSSSQEDMLAIYDRAFALGSLTRRPTPTFVDVILARASMQARAESVMIEEGESYLSLLC